ncbi:MAG: hypothetical protein JWN48_2126 [Myxococcaceae bacterium]|nr:hypothetical protein [Myxococcaceae bacterium]
MKLSMQQFQDQLIDYLYGQLEGEALREFERCLAESEACRSELATLQDTLTRTRSELRRDPEAPPPRVRAAVLAAAAEQLRVMPAAPAPAPLRAAAAPPAQTTKQTAQESSFWSLVRTPWLVPTLGVAAAVALLVFHKEVEAPRSTLERQPSEPELAPASSPAPLPAAERSVATTSAPKGYAEPPRHWRGQREEALRGARESHAEAERDERTAAPEQASLQDKARHATAPAAAPASVVAAAAPAPAKPAADGLARIGGAGAGSGGSYVRGPSASSAASSPRAEGAANVASASRKKSASSSRRDQLVARAQRQVVAAEWAQAIASYRELLKHFPDDPQVSGWRGQLAQLVQQHPDAVR